VPRATTTYEVVIASPSDVVSERKILVEVMEDWNSSHSRSAQALLLPRRWELDAIPNAEGHPQDWINRELIESADILIAVFQARIGSPTKRSISGTVEEIQKFITTGKPTFIYFSNAQIPRDHDQDQFNALENFKRQLKDKALYNEFASDEDLRRKAHRALARVMDKSLTEAREPLASRAPDTVLSEDAVELLVEASRDKYGSILCTRTNSGDSMQANGKEFIDDRSVRLYARWKAALQELIDGGLLEQNDSDGETFELTNSGFTLASEKESQLPLNLEIVPHGNNSDHALAISSSKNIKLIRLEFMTSGDIAISEQDISLEGDHFLVKLDQVALTELFNIPRPDMNNYDMSGPIKLNVVLSASGVEHVVTVPARLGSNISGSTAYREISRSPFRATLK
jgi:hypothetical protein